MLVGMSLRLLCVLLVELAFAASMSGAQGNVRRALPVQPLPGAQPSPTPSLPFFRNSGVADDPSGAVGASIYPADAPQTAASSAIMIDARSGSVLFFKNPDVRRPVASTQKLLNALLLVQNANLDASHRGLSAAFTLHPPKLGF